MSCPCDRLHCPAPLTFAAGLPRLPRAPGGFAQWRGQLLAAIGRERALSAWRAREAGDLGLMLLEMGAYVLDVTSFYDQLVANESYLGTAQLPGARRRHVGLLGYLPRPAIGSAAWLAAEADGTRLLRLPAGSAVRSGAFGSEPPQVFETETESVLEPRVNRFAVARVPATALPSPLSGITVVPGSVRVRAGALLLVAAGGVLAATRVAAHLALRLRSRVPTTRLDFTDSLTPGAGATYATTRLFTPGAACGAWKRTPASGEPAVLAGAALSLDTRVPIRVGDLVAITAGSTLAARRVTAVAEVDYTLLGPLTSEVKNASNAVVGRLTSPAIRIQVTRLTFDSALPSSLAAAQLTVHYGMVEAATVLAPLADTLTQGDPVVMPDFFDAPRTPVTQLLLTDVHGEAVAATGSLDAATHSAIPDSSPPWGRALWAPVTLWGNVIAVTRGESVHGEVLGRGDASQPTQTFRLKKKPLTYLSALSAAGRRSTLSVHVGAVRWHEVESFYGVAPEAMVYTVRHTDDGETDVTFGGGARLQSGAAVVADYRFGAGAPLPPADSIKQLARPLAGLRRLFNPLAAYGGSAAETPAELGLRGPQSALLLGRAISLADFEVCAAGQPGVRAARAAWRWDAEGLGPAVVVTIIGDAQIAPAVLATLRAQAEEGAPISVQVATAQAARLDLDIALDGDAVPGEVIGHVAAALYAAVTLPGSGGLLRAQNLGPEGVLFASALVQAVMHIPGVEALRSLVFDGSPFTEVGRRPAAGAYFDFDAGGVWVNGQRAG